MAKQPKKLIANNKKVYHDYFLEETFEAGIALAGTEVKSMRMGKCSIKESFIHIENGVKASDRNSQEILIIISDSLPSSTQTYLPNFGSIR